MTSVHEAEQVKKRRRLRGLSETHVGMLMIFPTVGLLIAMFGVPIALSVKDSFYNINTITQESRGVGLENYKWLFSDMTVAEAFIRSVIWTGCLVSGEVILGLTIAVTLNQKFRGDSFLRAVVVFPYIMPTIVVVLVWKNIMDPTYGVLNRILGLLHITDTGIAWLGDPGTSLPSVILIGIWKYAPFMALLLLARLQSVPEELYEAASLDGAGKWAQFRYISLPWMMPVLVSVILIRTVWGFNDFDLVYLPANGGPLGSTTTLPVLIRQIGFSDLNLGRASAVANAMALFLILCSVGVFTVQRRARLD